MTCILQNLLGVTRNRYVCNPRKPLSSILPLLLLGLLYQSPIDNRKEYYDTFCTRRYASRWTEYGLRFVPQPGTYWELKDKNVTLTVIGIDTGKSGKLDGHKRLWATLPPDHQQYKWLEERLTLADKDEKDVIIVLHIPWHLFVIANQHLVQNGKKNLSVNHVL